MSHITLKGRPSGYTQVCNTFIDEHMTDANESQIKIYLYLLRCMGAGMGVSVSSIADRFNYMEKDILRALMYWDKQGLLSVEFDSDKNIVSIYLNDCLVAADDDTATSESEPGSIENVASNMVTSDPDSTSHFYPQDQIMQFKNMEEVRSLIFMTEHYLGKALSKNDINTLIYMYDELHFPVELLEFLIEYCVNNGHRNMRYIEKTAIAWAADNITSVEAAKKSISRFRKEYYDILKAYGISNRNPVEVEIEYMSKWLDEYCFEINMIEEAINRTIINISKPSYSYTDKILSDWYAKKITSLNMLPDYDKERPKKRVNTPKSATKFSNFTERDLDFNEIAKEFIKN